MSARNPRSSPDGRLLAYVGLEGERQRTLVVRSRTGLDPRELVRVDDASDAVLNGPQWSPDGRRIAFARAAAGAAHEIVVVDLEGQERVLVTSPPGTAALFPTFTGDGRSVVYQFEAPGVARQLWIVPVAGGEPRPLTSGDHEHSHPQGTPARPGEILLVVDHENIGVVSQRTGDLTLLTEFDDSTALLDYPSWSPDGSRIYFSITRKVGDLFMMETPRSAAAASSGTRRP